MWSTDMEFLKDEGHARMTPAPSASISGFAVALWILACILILLGLITFTGGISDHNDGESNIRAGAIISGILFAAFGAAINKLHQIERHLRPK